MEHRARESGSFLLTDRLLNPWVSSFSRKDIVHHTQGFNPLVNSCASKEHHAPHSGIDKLLHHYVTSAHERTTRKYFSLPLKNLLGQRKLLHGIFLLFLFLCLSRASSGPDCCGFVKLSLVCFYAQEVVSKRMIGIASSLPCKHRIVAICLHTTSSAPATAPSYFL